MWWEYVRSSLTKTSLSQIHSIGNDQSSPRFRNVWVQASVVCEPTISSELGFVCVEAKLCCCVPLTGLDFVFHMFFLIKYCKSLEEGGNKGGRGRREGERDANKLHVNSNCCQHTWTALRADTAPALPIGSSARR